MRDLLAQEAATCGRRKPWRCSVTRRRNGSAPSPRRSADWTRSSSPAASANMRRSIRARICDGLGFLGIELDEARNAEDAARDFHGRQPGHRARHPHRRRTHDRAIGVRVPVLARHGRAIEMTEYEKTHKDPDPGTAAQDGRLLARRELSVGRPDLSLRQSAAEEAAQAGAHQAAPARPLGHDARAELHLRPSEPRHQGTRSERDLHHRPGPRRAGHRGQHLSRRHLQRGLSQHLAGRGRDEAAVQAVLVSRRHSEPRRAGDAGLDSRRRRTGLLAVARLSARRSTIPTCSSPASSAMAKRRPARSRRAGTRTNFSIRSTTAPCCRSCI